MKKISIFIMSMIMFSFVFGQRDLNYVPSRVISGESQYKQLDLSKNSSKGFLESFEVSVPPEGWTKINPTGGSGWGQVGYGETVSGWQDANFTQLAGGGSKVAYATYNTGGTSNNDQWLVTPAIDVIADDSLIFYLSVLSNYADSLSILVSESGTEVTDFTALEVMGFAAPLPWTKKSYSLAAYAGKTIYIAFREYVASNGVNGAVVGIDLVKAGSISGLDVSLTEINVPKFVKKGESKTFSGKIINNGGDNITSYDVTYECEGNTSAVYSVTGINIATTQMHEFTHDAPYTFNNEGVHDVTIKISNVNGGGETNLDNNQKTSQVSVYDNSVERNVLLENFTTGQCPNCPPVHQLLENYIETQPKAILIAQHAGFYTDDMTIPENTELLVLYNSSGSYAPALSVDRFHFPTGLGGGSPDPGPVFFPNGAAATQRIEDRLNVPAFVSVDINKVASSKGDITFKVSGEFVSGVAGSDLRLGVYIIEDSLIYPQSGGNANYVHNNVMRDAISETWGDAGIITSTTAGSTFEKTYTYTLNDSWKEDKLSIVAFVANYDASDVNKRDILNAKEVKLTELEVAANEDIAGSDINIYPNPATDYVTISNVENSQIDIFDITGKLVKSLNADNQNITVNVNDLGAGTYILRVRNATNVVTKKLTIK